MIFRGKCLGFAIILMLYMLAVNAQHWKMHPRLTIDTSYTIHSAFRKQLKKYPNITIATYQPVNKLKINRNLVYHSYHKRKMHLDLFRPSLSVKKQLPCVLLIHGGGWNSGDKSLLEPYALALADSGYVALTIEYRFSDEAKYPAAVIDITTALKWVYANAMKYGIDTNKVSMLGCSAGGQLATLVGVTSNVDTYNDPTVFPNHHPKIKAIIDIDGVIAFIHPLSEEGKNSKGAAEKWFGVHYQVDPAKWIEASPITYVGADTPPTLFIASSVPRFNAGRQDMIEIMNGFSIYNETYVFEDAPHTFWLFNPWFKPTLSQILIFLKRVGNR